VDYLEKIFPPEIELFLFTTEKFKNQYSSKRVKIVDTHCNKYNSIFELRKFCINNKIDRLMNIGVVPQESIAMTFASLFTKTDFICFVLGDPVTALRFVENKAKLKTFFETIFFYPLSIFPKKMFICSKEIFKILKRRLFFLKNIFYAPPTIDTSLFIPKNKKDCRVKLKLSSREKIVIYVGRIHVSKGSDILLQVIKDNPDKRFILIGKLMDKNFEKHTPANLTLISPKIHKELVDYYNASNLCLFLSKIEGLPLAPRESMSCGIPSIVSDILGSKPIKYAIKVPLNLKEINKEINNFFNLPAKERKQLSSDSRNSIVREYGEDACKELYLSLMLT
jgi:glycosyltransferase involved in cell wall biosynthesis